jgi:hypothetical protein
MKMLIDKLADDDNNDELVDMIAEKLVNKLIGFQPVALPPQQVANVAAVEAPNMAAMLTGSPKLATAPAAKFDDSKLTKLQGETKADAVPVWGNKYKLKKVENPYESVAFPTIGDRPQGLAETDKIKRKSTYKPGPEYQNMGSEDYEKLNGAKGFGAARDMDKGLDYLQGLGRGDAPKLDEVEEEPDAITVIAVGLISAFVGSAATLVVYHRFGFGKAKTGMQLPLLTN